MTPVLEALEVSYRIGGKTLIQGVSFAVTEGETVALVGPNGAGKSTLLRALSGEIGCTEGAVRLKGRAPRAYGSRALALHRAVLSQSTTVTFPFSVREIVQMGSGEYRGVAVNDMVDRALAEVDLEGFQDRVIGTLSGGEQQRAHFARVLVQLACGEAAQGPGVLLLDEPTASLDLRHQIDIVASAHRRAAKGAAVIAVLHDLNLATLFAKRIIVLDRSRIAGDGPPAQTITNEIVDKVFGVVEAVSQTPSAGTPFVLPHAARKTER